MKNYIGDASDQYQKINSMPEKKKIESNFFR
jgi:hypothetical protein